MVHDSYYEKEDSHRQQHGPTQDLTLVEERALELHCVLHCSAWKFTLHTILINAPYNIT